MKRIFSLAVILLFISIAFSDILAQRKKSKGPATTSSMLADSVFSGISLRNIGPALMSGRIADIAIHPSNENVWYVAVGSGGVWKTTNAGITWKPIFDSQPSYSIGCVSIDPNNPHTIWVGTGENVGGRHVGFGDGIYRSDDAGNSWKNMGLETSEHISKIIVHPTNSEVIFVAAQGPLWSSGGERGFYKSTDGGKSWKQTLGDNQWVGVTDIAIDPRDANRIYAATWQRHRTVAAYMGGGPGSGIHRSLDGGDTWQKLSRGIPKENLGKIGLAISPQNPDVLYAAIEMHNLKGGLFKSSDRGVSWSKQSNTVSGGTGPHYYQELYAHPHYEGKLYLMNNYMLVSDDGGKTFNRLNREGKHVDNHAIAFKKSDKDFLLVGTDGGLYETFDLGQNWRFIDNLPVTQFYKVALDDAEPFYNVFGGTQDNNTMGGPVRTDNVHGIMNADWRIILGGDGHQPATEPGNPNIMYAESQQGYLSRIDMVTGETVAIKPQPGVDEPFERFNWDSPILVSPHSPTTLYFASQRVWKSTNRGDKWEAISGDLTRNQIRLSLPIMGRTQSMDNAWDIGAMSIYNSITSVSESPKRAGLLYAGTDDGLIQVTENGGQSWRKIEARSLPGVPSRAFVNDIKADLHNENTVYVALDNHKYGDFKPYLMKSTDKGVTWTSIKGNLPDKTLVWRIVQDHENANLMFLATEFGIYFTIDGGNKWIKLNGGVPTISFRDLAIHKRENDLVAASFGRGFYVLDDYSFLREVSEEQLNAQATLFNTRKAWWYVPRSVLSFGGKHGSQGMQHYVADNPAFGAVFNYYLKEGLKSRKKIRQESEKAVGDGNIPFPGWDKLAEEKNENGPKIWLVVQDNAGNVVRRISGPTKKGFNKVNWDLRYPSISSIDPDANEDPGPGLLAVPGQYTATLYSQVDGKFEQLDDPITFDVIPLRNGALEGASPDELSKFWTAVKQTSKQVQAFRITLNVELNKVNAMVRSVQGANLEPGELDLEIETLRQKMLKLQAQVVGNKASNEMRERSITTLNSRLNSFRWPSYRSTYGPTETHRTSLEIVNVELAKFSEQLESYQKEISVLSQKLINAGAPWIEGSVLPKN